MSNYNADIRIGVVGQSKLKTLQKDLDKINASVNKLNKALVLKARAQTIKLNTKGAAAQLRLLENQLNKLGRVITVKVRTSEEKGKASSNSTVIASGSNQSAAIGLASLKRQSALQKEITNQSKSESAAAEVTERIRNQIEQTDRAILKTREEQARLNKGLPEQRGNRKLSFKDQIQQLSDAGQLSKKVSGDFDKLKTRLADLGPGDAGKEYKRFFEGIKDGTKRLAAAQGQAEEAARTGIQKQIKERERLETRKQQLLKRGETAEIAGVNRTTEAIKNELKEREAAEIAYEQRRQRRLKRIQQRDELRAKKARGQNFKKGAGGAAGIAASSALSGIPGLGGIASGATVGFFTGGAPGAVGGAIAGGVADGIAGLAALSKEAAITRAEFDKLQISLRLAAGSEFDSSVEAIRRVVDDFNAPLVDTTEQFTKLYAASQGSGIAFSELEDLFVGLSAANKAYAGDAEDLNGILRAFTQIISKGTVQSEELKGQVGERLPGAFKKAADSLGLTTAQLQKALEQGEIQSADFVKKFGKYMLQYEEDAKIIAQSPAEAGARLEVALVDLNNRIGPVFASLGAQFQDFATAAVNALIPLVDYLNQLFDVGSNADRLDQKIGKVLQLNQKIFEVETKRNGLADETARNALSGDLASLTNRRDILQGEADELRKLLGAQKRTTEAANTIKPTTQDDSLKPTGKGSKSGPADTTAQTRVELQLQQELLRIEQEKFALVGQEATLQDFKLQRQTLEAGLAASLQDIDQDNITAASKIAEKELERVKYATDLQAIKNAEKEFTIEQTKAFEEQVLELQNAIELESAITDEMKRQVVLKQALAEIEGSELSEPRKDKLKELQTELSRLQSDNANPINQYFNQLQEEVGNTEQMIVDLARTVESELSSAMSSAVTGLIDGTTTAQEAFADMFKNIGKAFIDMATKMIAKALVMKALGILTGGGGGGGGGGMFNSVAEIGGAGFVSPFAEGGRPPVGQTSLVGERGPELFVPDSPGTVLSYQDSKAALSSYSRMSPDEQKAADKGEDPMSGGVATAMQPIQMDTRVINGVEYATVKQMQEAAQVAAAEGAKQGAKIGEAQTLRRLRMNPSVRRQVGI